MAAHTALEFEKVLSHTWREPKSMAQTELAEHLFDPEAEKIDLDWWEPRHDQPWRRQGWRDRETFGGEYVAQPRPPVEGPNNPNRLRRELQDEAESLARAEGSSLEVAEEVDKATERIASLRRRLEEVEDVR